MLDNCSENELDRYLSIVKDKADKIDTKMLKNESEGEEDEEVKQESAVSILPQELVKAEADQIQAYAGESEDEVIDGDYQDRLEVI